MENKLAVQMPVTLVEAHDDRWYKIVVEETVYYLPSVTTKLGILDKPFLARWRGDIGNREADMRVYEASERGKRIHWAFSIALQGGAVVYDPWQAPVYREEDIAAIKAQHGGRVAILRTQDEMFQIHKLQMQFNILKPKVLAVETPVYDLDNKDAGTIDHVYEILGGKYLVAGKTPLSLSGGIYVGDLKTGKAVDETAFMQVAAYSQMWEKIHDVKVAGALITHTNSQLKSGIPGLNTILIKREELVEAYYPTYRKAAALWEDQHKEDRPALYEFPSIIKLGGLQNERIQ